MADRPVVVALSDGLPLPDLPPVFQIRTTRDSEEALRIGRTDHALAFVVAARREVLPILVSRIHDEAPQPVVALTPNEPREMIRAVAAGAWDAAMGGTLAKVLGEAVEEGRRLLAGEPERLGPYEMLEIVGRGGMSTVWRARRDGRDAALKVLAPELAGDAEFVSRFRREAKSAAALHHPRLMEVYDHGQSRHRLWIAMELLRGRALDVILRRGERFTPERALRVGRQVAEGLAYAHDQGYIHRDIKPSNLVLDAGDAVKIMDFGLLKSTSADETPITRGNEFVGTLVYAAPEQINSPDCDARADLYSLGVVLFEMIGGVRPFSGENVLILRSKESGQLPFRLAEINPAVPKPVVDLVEKMMAPAPDARYATAGDVIAAIDRISA